MSRGYTTTQPAVIAELQEAGVPTFERRELHEERKITQGAFGELILGRLDGTPVVIKSMKSINTENYYLRLMVKEIKLLRSLSHPNIVILKGVRIHPLAPVLEFMEFNLDEMDFPDSDSLRSGNDLDDLLERLMENNLVKPFGVERGWLYTACLHVARGLAYLHEQDICHRDPTQSNVLVRNIGEQLVFKLTDFGEARGLLIRTNSEPNAESSATKRGRPVFFSPEQMLEEKDPTDMAALKKIDIWTFGMLIFCIINTDLYYPWALELKVEYSLDPIKEIMRNKGYPQGSVKYEEIGRITGLAAVMKRCCEYDLSKRPSADEVVALIESLPREGGSPHTEPDAGAAAEAV